MDSKPSLGIGNALLKKVVRKNLPFAMHGRKAARSGQTKLVVNAADAEEPPRKQKSKYENPD
jgi:hypothetical protein